MSTFIDLPQELQIEIFSTLSVKHLPNILCINKSTHDQIIHSETFWKTLVHNHSKGIKINPLSNDQEFNLSLYHNQLIELGQMRKKELLTFTMTIRKFQLIHQKLLMVEEELRASVERNKELSSAIDVKIQDVKKKVDEIKKAFAELSEKIKVLTID